MYISTSIDKLSPNQIGKLLKGERVRIKAGIHHKVNLSKEQHKKLSSAHSKGKGITLQFDPYQCGEMHGHLHAEGGKIHFWKELGNIEKVGNRLAKTLKPVAKPLISALVQKGVSSLAGSGEGEGVKKHHARRASHVKGGKIHFWKEFGNIEKVGNRLAKTLKPVAKPLISALVQKGVSSLAGSGVRGRPRKHAKKGKGEALFPAGYSGHGEALFPAGYDASMFQGHGEGEGFGEGYW